MLSPHELIAQRDYVLNDNERGGRDTAAADLSASVSSVPSIVF